MASSEGAALDAIDTATSAEPISKPDTEIKGSSDDVSISDPPDSTADTSPVVPTAPDEPGDDQKSESPPPLPSESDGDQVVSKKPKTEAIPPSIPEALYRAEWTPKLGRAVVIDRIKGCLYGNALGDAMGLATEFMSKIELKKCYTKPGPIHFEDFAKDFHRCRWNIGDWTDDTDQMLLILEGMVESGGKVEAAEFARKLLNWSRKGFPELGDYGGLGIGMTVHRTITHSRFLSDPHLAAREVWEESGKYLAANGAVMRTSVLGLLCFNQIETVIRNTLEISRTTHADPRCSASCVAITTLISQLLQSSSPCSQTEVNKIMEVSIQEGRKLLEDQKEKDEFVKHMKADSFQKLSLDDAKSIGYTLKCAGSGFVGLRSKVKNAKGFIKMMTELVREGGDADTNGAVCGAVVGCMLGYSNLPLDWIKKMPYIDWYDRKVEQFLTCVGLGSEEDVTAKVV